MAGFVNYIPRTGAQPINDATVPSSTFSQPGAPSGFEDGAMGAIIRSLQGQPGVLPPGFGGGPTPAPVAQGPGPSTVPAPVVPPVQQGGAQGGMGSFTPVPLGPWAQGTSRGGFLNPFTGIVPKHLSAVAGAGHARPAYPAGAAPSSFAQWFQAHQAAQTPGVQHPLVQLLQGLLGQQAPAV